MRVPPRFIAPVPLPPSAPAAAVREPALADTKSDTKTPPAPEYTYCDLLRANSQLTAALYRQTLPPAPPPLLTRLRTALTRVLAGEDGGGLPIPPLIQIIAEYANCVVPISGTVVCGEPNELSRRHDFEDNPNGLEAHLAHPRAAIAYYGPIPRDPDPDPSVPQLCVSVGGKQARGRVTSTNAATGERIPPPAPVWTDPKREVILFCDFHSVRFLDLKTHEVGTFCGGRNTRISPPQPAIPINDFHFDYALGLCVSPRDGSVYVTDAQHRIVKINLNPNDTSGFGLVTNFAGSNKGEFGFCDATGTNARFSSPGGIVCTSDGRTLYVADSANNRVRAVDVSSGAVTTVLGTGRRAHTVTTTDDDDDSNGDGSGCAIDAYGCRGARASIHWPHNLCFDQSVSPGAWERDRMLYIASSNLLRTFDTQTKATGIIHVALPERCHMDQIVWLATNYLVLIISGERLYPPPNFMFTVHTLTGATSVIKTADYRPVLIAEFGYGGRAVEFVEPAGVVVRQLPNGDDELYVTNTANIRRLTGTILPLLPYD